MSQEKVDRYKQSKVNRKKEVKKEKQKNLLRNIILGAAALAVVGWLGYSAYDSLTSGQGRDVAEVNYDSVSDYMSGLYQE